MDRIGLEHRLELALGVYCIFNVSGAATITIDCLVDLVHELLLDELSKRVVRSRLDGFLKEYYPSASLFLLMSCLPHCISHLPAKHPCP